VRRRDFIKVIAGSGVAWPLAFRAARQPLGQALLDNRGRAMHAAGHLAIDRWQGDKRV
jgi:single-stranded-DNA-specific exonuclease